MKKLGLDSYQQTKETKKRTISFWEKFPQKYIHERHNHLVSGDYIYNSKNTLNSYVVDEIENSKFCAYVSAGTKTADCYDFTHFGASSELLYESLQAGNVAANLRFCFFTILNTSDLEYCLFCTGSKNCFGCVGLKKKKYCIFNKQYSKEEFFKFKEKIISHMNRLPFIDKKGNKYKYGEFYPIEFSPFGYNATTAQEFFPLSKDEVNKEGYKWKVPEEKNYKIDILAKDLPDITENVGDDILSKVISCEHEGKCNEQCTEAFKIIPDELAFYRRMNLPLPRLCSNCRHYQRHKFVNPPKVWRRSCMCGSTGSLQATGKHFHGEEKCEVEFETSYAPDRSEVIYCERCYQQEVY